MCNEVTSSWSPLGKEEHSNKMIPIHRFFFLSIFLRRFINYCKDEEGYRGFTASEEDEDVVHRFAALYIAIESNGDISFFSSSSKLILKIQRFNAITVIF